MLGSADYGQCETTVIDKNDRVVGVQADFNDSDHLRRLRVDFAQGFSKTFGSFEGPWDGRFASFNFRSNNAVLLDVFGKVSTIETG